MVTRPTPVRRDLIASNCVEGLKHGERYTINLRAGLPSTVKEALPKAAEFNIYVRDRKPFVRFTSRAYALPRTGQRGIPLVSVNTPAVAVNIFRIGDRNLINSVLGSDFQRSNCDDFYNRDCHGNRQVPLNFQRAARTVTPWLPCR